MGNFINFAVTLKIIPLKITSLLLALVFTCGSLAANGRTISEAQLDSVLQLLDDEILHADTRRNSKNEHISLLRNELDRARSDEMRLSLMHSLYDEYRSYQNDSATHYATRMVALADATGNAAEAATARMTLLDSYLTVGFFKEASEVDACIDSSVLAPERRTEYFRLRARLFQNLESYVNRNSELGAQYAAERSAAYDSIIALTTPGSYDYEEARLERELVYKNIPELAVSTRLGFLQRPELTDHDRAINYSILGSVHQWNDMPDDAAYYFACSAIYDMRSNTRETTATKDLAALMLERGDIVRANRYIRLALDDANFFNSRLRSIEINAVLPHIEMARYNWLDSQRWTLIFIVVLVCMLLVATALLWLKLRNRNLRLAAFHDEITRKSDALEESNANLRRVNDELRKTTEIKDQYIMQSLYGNTDFVDEVESKLTKAISKLKARQYDELGRILYSIGVKQERQRMYISFDTAFLKLFPNFIEEFNRLFDEEHRIGVDSDGRLPTEIRIFALLRLGISNPVDVARYLNLSVNTVYVYKTRVKARARVPKNEFDDLVMAIPKI